MLLYGLGGYARLLGGVSLVSLFAGCAVLPGAEISIDGASHTKELEAVKVSIHPGRPVLLRAVDEKLLAAIQISNYLRPLTYILHSGRHVLWLSEPPAGVPFLPQRISCYVMRVHLVAGNGYVLELDRQVMLPVLRRVGVEEPEATGVVVDRPLVVERGCKWQ